MMTRLLRDSINRVVFTRMSKKQKRVNSTRFQDLVYFKRVESRGFIPKAPTHLFLLCQHVYVIASFYLVNTIVYILSRVNYLIYVHVFV